MELPVEQLPSPEDVLQMAKYPALLTMVQEVSKKLVDREPSRVDLPSPHTYTR
jgi:hypothetical protein